MPDGDFFRCVAIRIVGQVPTELVVKRELALLDQLPDRDLSKGLVDRTEVEPGIDSIWNVVFLACKTTGLLENNLVALAQQNRTGELVSRAELIKAAFNQRNDLRLRLRSWSFVFRDILRSLGILDA